MGVKEFSGKPGEIEMTPVFGVAEMSRAEVRGEIGDSCDSWAADEKNGFFALFDGAGSRGARRASQMAKDFCEDAIDNDDVPENYKGLVEMLSDINDELASDYSAGASTGILAKVHIDEEGPCFDFASIGDSRIYVVREGKAYQITIDDGYTDEDLEKMGVLPEDRQKYIDHGISKYLNMNYFSVSEGNYGRVRLSETDRIMICSDGISGDTDIDIMPKEEIAEIVSKGDSENAANGLVSRAKKIDDRTAIVIDVESFCRNFNEDNEEESNDFSPKIAENIEFDPNSAEKYRILAKLIDEDDEELCEKYGFDSSDEKQVFYDLRKNDLMPDERERDYLKGDGAYKGGGVKRPADLLVDGYQGVKDEDKFRMACQARFNLDSTKINETHFRRILEASSGGSFSHPEKASGASYARFLEKFPTAADYDEFSEDLLGKIIEANKGNGNKGAEYTEDMKKFKELMYGDQQEQWDLMKEMNAEADIKGREFDEGNIVKNTTEGNEAISDVDQEFYDILRSFSDEETEKTEEDDDGPVENSLRWSKNLPAGYQIISGGYRTMEALRRDYGNFLRELGYTARQLEDGNYYCVRDNNNYWYN